MSLYYDPFDSQSSLAAFSVVPTDQQHDLLDDDPFAASTPVSSPSKPIDPVPIPASRLAPQQRPPARTHRTASFIRTIPAHAKPAFRPRPSLPSLHTLSTMDTHLVLPKKPRKGHVGAQLPFEPWNLSPDTSLTLSPVSSSDGPHNDFFIPAPSPTGTCFLTNMDSGYRYHSDDSDEEEPEFDPYQSTSSSSTELEVLEEDPQEEHVQDASNTRHSSGSDPADTQGQDARRFSSSSSVSTESIHEEDNSAVTDASHLLTCHLRRSVSQHSGSTFSSLGPLSPISSEVESGVHGSSEDYLSYDHNPSFLNDRGHDFTIKAVTAGTVHHAHQIFDLPQKIDNTDPDPDLHLDLLSTCSSSNSSSNGHGSSSDSQTHQSLNITPLTTPSFGLRYSRQFPSAFSNSNPFAEPPTLPNVAPTNSSNSNVANSLRIDDEELGLLFDQQYQASSYIIGAKEDIDVTCKRQRQRILIGRRRCRCQR
ncbi:hypothetical protein K435DRAFT_311160 [Dendrothele bispora CBS 962.96]|uniref:Uncharacterized protein n=1 Tax=Dendrothele bispora (strain CBS 962.96) TaxID=1314807 RepID=A0A4S8MJT6_DENBC|nr:hypothetical protein K435DRAFT_311160 [Dendrothele bispora CBS 962.96]